MRLFLFPHAGGSALMYQNWPAQFPAGWRVTTLDAPGHGTLAGQPPLSDGDALVAHHLDRLAPELGAGEPAFALFGHSMGALVAYELARRLTARGRPPVWLGLSACGAPRRNGPPVPARARELSDEELRRRVAQLGGTPPKVLNHPGLWRYFAPVIRADLRLVESWRPAPAGEPLPVPVSLFGGAEDAVVGPAALERWSGHCARLLATHVFPGGHFYFQDDLAAVARAVTHDVTEALRPASAPGR
ncbi:thioesterase II family protein [Streptomyces sp. NBC_00557]|uniref:thioesterase II family protein n=1 Tax=Streptomyces sp. NBC_00557 TaxID=2975776 RepID=UPI002E801C0C|nr:alpha/beta fold hydrolase [Streptomyces sp. NBC_00557]WUC40173.1 alpha/beta fold hydrolase [Streptomyces sp. NBC_00557]